MSVSGDGFAEVQQRLAWAWQTALGREPSGKELNVARAFLGETRKRYQADAKAADKLLAVGMLRLPVDIAKPETAAWTVLGQTLLNLSETITRN